jgi:hypothetical protein
MKIILDSITFVPLIETLQNDNLKWVERTKTMYFDFIVMHIYVFGFTNIYSYIFSM